MVPTWVLTTKGRKYQVTGHSADTGHSFRTFRVVRQWSKGWVKIRPVCVRERERERERERRERGIEGNSVYEKGEKKRGTATDCVRNKTTSVLSVTQFSPAFGTPKF